jgi:hypothetical protein
MWQFLLPLVTRHERQVQLTSCAVVTRLPTCCRPFHNPNQWERAEDTELFYTSTSVSFCEASIPQHMYSHLFLKNDRSNRIAILVFRRLLPTVCCGFCTNFYREHCKYPWHCKTTNCLSIHKTCFTVFALVATPRLP